MNKRLLITGFEPFGGQSINPSWLAVSGLGDSVCGWELKKVLVPVEFGTAGQCVIAAAEEFGPDAILCVGQAGGRAAVTPELVAINLRHGSIPDNAGLMPEDEPVVPGGREAYFATVPVRKMAQAIRDASVRGAVSYSAGAYVCNDLLYTLLHRYNGTETRVGFIHVPFLPEQAEGTDRPSMSLDDMVTALNAAISAL